MSFISKAIRKATGQVDKLFGSSLAKKWRSIDPIAKLVGEEYQRHIFHSLLNPLGPVGGYFMDYASMRNRGIDAKTAHRKTYQNMGKSGVILATIFGIGAVAGTGEGAAAGAAAEGGTGLGAATVDGFTTTIPNVAGTSSITGAEFGAMSTAQLEAGALAAETGAAYVAPSGVSVTGTSQDPSSAVGTPKATTAATTPTEPTSMLGKVAKMATDNPMLTYGGMQLLGSAIQGMNTPSAGEDEAGRIRARQDANNISGMGTSGGQTPKYKPYQAPAQPVRVLSVQELLTAGGFNSQFNPVKPTSGLLTQAGVGSRAGFGG